MADEQQNMALQTKKINWKNIFLYYSIAFLISAPINSFHFIDKWNKLTEGTVFYKIPFLLAGIGTLIAGLIALQFDKKTIRKITLFGSNKIKSIVMSLIPLIGVTIIGMPNHLSLNEQLYAFLISIVIYIYTFTEEIFWRGYLINVLNSLGWIKNYFSLGLLWWAWHFNFSNYGLTTFLVLIVASSFLIGKFVQGTKSYLTAVGLHSLIVILTLGEYTKPLLYLSGFILVLWFFIDKFWATRIENEKT